MPLQTDNLQSG